MDPQLKSQLRETIYVATASSVDAAGDATFAAAASRLARVVNVSDTIEQADGTKLKTTVAIITEAEIPMNARVWLPGVDQTDNSLSRVPRFVERAVDERGNLDFFRTKL
tara:strand:- start:136 stop:462 length:327 start_codon:yes stop_codon:yes gene_type:complete